MKRKLITSTTSAVLTLGLLSLTGAAFAQNEGGSGGSSGGKKSTQKPAQTTKEAKATCTGSKSCRACKNCKYCKHCAKGGGTCGVCKPKGRKTPVVKEA